MKTGTAAIIMSLAMLASVSPALAGARAATVQPSPLVRMFDWWNDAMRTPGALSPAAFARYYTDDAALIIDGAEVARGTVALSAHFAKIQASGATVRIVTPFEAEFRSGDSIYTYHVIRSVRDGHAGCMLAAGHAQMRGDRIALISLVRTKIDPASPVFAAKCR